ncbi:MAG: alpha/beta hydrolase [Arenimonas sp.]
MTIQAADGLPLAAESHAGERVSVLLAHGFGQTRQSWATTQSRLALAGHANLSWDMRGHGRSGRNPSDRAYQPEQFVDDVLSVARTLPPKPVLVGASMGGLTGLMAQSFAAPFSALVLVDVTPQWEAAGVARIVGFMTAHPDGFDDFEHAADAISAYLPHRRERKRASQLEHLLRRDDDGRLRWHWDPRLIEEFVLGSHQLQDRISEATRGIDVPVLLVSGGRSDIVSERTIAHFQSLLPDAQHVHLPDATHMVAGDDNDAFSDALLRFLGAHYPHPADLRAAPLSTDKSNGTESAAVSGANA